VSTVLVVEDDASLRRALATTLRAREFEVIECESGEEGVRAAGSRQPDLVVLDLALPGIDGMQVLTELRAASEVPVVVLTVRDRRDDKIAALDAGADDYVVKPFDTEELLARIRAALRRHRRGAEPPGVVVTGDLEIDLSRRLVRLGGEPVHLTRTELHLLEVLITNPGRLVTHEQLARRVDPDGTAGAATLRVHVGNLRRKLHDDAARPRFILTEPGLGYRWLPGGDA
jgi:two-component system KDP operon response regulator KdpE